MNKVALITGGTGGIGSAIAGKLADYVIGIIRESEKYEPGSDIILHSV